MHEQNMIHVLLVEDEEYDKYIIEDHLSQAEYVNFKMTWKSDKDEVLDEINKSIYDVVLLDQDLVGYTGLEVLKIARYQGNMKAMIFLSGSKDPNLRKNALISGASGFLFKGQVSPPLLEITILFAIEKARSLMDLEERVERRTEELTRTLKQMENLNKELVETQARMVEQETLANLGSLVSGVAHEVNTPLGTSVTAASHLKDKTDSVSQAYRHGEMSKSQLEGYIDTAAESSTIILSNLKRAADLITSFKRIAVDQAGHQKRNFSLKQCLEDVILSLKPRFKGIHLNINTTCPDDLMLDSYPGIYAQIFTNLITNSITHAFENTHSGDIDIQVTPNKERLTITYSDNGVGMESTVREKLFLPFFTTKRNHGGSGLGTSIIFNSVQQLGGTISVDSTPKTGTTFTISIPTHIDEDDIMA